MSPRCSILARRARRQDRLRIRAQLSPPPPFPLLERDLGVQRRIATMTTAVHDRPEVKGGSSSNSLKQKQKLPLIDEPN